MKSKRDPIAVEVPTLEKLQRLLALPEGLRISIYLALPPHPGFSEQQQTPKRYLSLVARAAARLEQQGYSDVDAITEMLSTVQVEHRAVHPAARAIAVLASGESAAAFVLMDSAEDRVHVGRSYALRPILADVHRNRSYRVLTVSDLKIGLFAGDRHGLLAVSAPDVPADIAAALGTEISRHSNTLQIHSSSSRGGQGVFHGHGGADTGREVDHERYHKLIARSVHKLWAGQHEPIVLACDVSHQAPLRAKLGLPALLEQGLSGNPDQFSDRELAERAWPLVDAQREREDQQSIRLLGSALAHDRATDSIDEAVHAASSGRIESLWVDVSAREPGHIDRETGGRVLANGDEDLFDEIAALVLGTGGKVLATDLLRGCGDQKLVAKLRV